MPNISMNILTVAQGNILMLQDFKLLLPVVDWNYSLLY